MDNYNEKLRILVGIYSDHDRGSMKAMERFLKSCDAGKIKKGTKHMIFLQAKHRASNSVKNKMDYLIYVRKYETFQNINHNFLPVLKTFFGAK